MPIESIHCHVLGAHLTRIIGLEGEIVRITRRLGGNTSHMPQADRAGLSRTAARLEPLVCVEG